MPPVEVASYISSPILSTDLKVVDKAMQLPVVSDAVSEVSKYAHNLSENHAVKHARQLVGGCLQGLSENETVLSMKETVRPLTATVKDTLLPRLTPVKETVLPRVAGALETLDSIACGGLDQLKTAVPSLTSPTPELFETVREAASGYCSMLAEYLASFSLAQFSLKLADRGLVLLERATSRTLPETKSIIYVRAARRSVRAARRAGARRNFLNSDELSRSGLLGRVASALRINTLLDLVGLELIPTVVAARLKSRLATEDLPEARIEDIHADMSGYCSEDDPDFEAGTSSSSSDSEDSKGGSDSDDEVMKEEEEDENEDGKASSGRRSTNVSSADELNEDSIVEES